MASVPTGPDFDAISSALSTISANVSLIPNLPAVDHGAVVLQRLELLMTEVQTVKREQREGFARFESALNVLQRESTAR